jgi:hypothetical protein
VVGRHSPGIRLAGLAALAAVAVAVCVRVYAVNPEEPGHYPLCPFRMLTSLDCPGCGTLRGLHQALHGNIVAAADYNLYFVVATPMLVVAWMVGVARLMGLRISLPVFPPRLVPLVPILIIAFWVGRNLPVPGLAWLHS